MGFSLSHLFKQLERIYATSVCLIDKHESINKAIDVPEFLTVNMCLLVTYQPWDVTQHVLHPNPATKSNAPFNLFLHFLKVTTPFFQRSKNTECPQLNIWEYVSRQINQLS